MQSVQTLYLNLKFDILIKTLHTHHEMTSSDDSSDEVISPTRSSGHSEVVSDSNMVKQSEEKSQGYGMLMNDWPPH